jgi:colanic acid/amylovoran biosynthesis glycosyltransferase
MENLKLVLLPGLKAKKISFNEIVITRKFLDGVNEYQKYWGGEIQVLLEEDIFISNNLDNITVNINNLPFQIGILNYDSAEFRQSLGPGIVVLAYISDRQNKISSYCRQINVSCVYILLLKTPW